MFKIHLPQNKATLIGLAIIVLFLMMVGINLLVITPAVLQTYMGDKTPPPASPINTQTVNDAIEVLGQ